MAKKDYYDILGISRTASQSEIKKAYRRLARKYHPDINPGDRQAEERFKEIQAAYSILNDSEKRRNYDQFGRAEGPGFQDFEGFQGFGFEEPGRGFGGFGDIFSDLFGRTRSAPRAPRPRGGGDLEYQVSIPFLDAVNGTRTRIRSRRHHCCSRVGWYSDAATETSTR